MTNDEPKGAFMEQAMKVIDEDMARKRTLFQDIVDNPSKYPDMTTERMLEILLGDYQVFINKLGEE